jgi:hypothetical protein
VLPHDVCLDILKKDTAAGQYDADLVKAFCEIPSLGLASASVLPAAVAAAPLRLSHAVQASRQPLSVA